MKKLFSKSWRTTVTGGAIAVLIAIQPFFQDGGFQWKTDAPKLVIAVLLAIFGYWAKDKNVSGTGSTGEKGQ